MGELEIQFPEDFEERYNAYKVNLLGQTNNKLKASPTIYYEESNTKKYQGVKEVIDIKTLSIKIHDYSISRRGIKKKINSTDKFLIFFLYYKYIENKDECFKIAQLVLEMETEIGRKTPRYIKNRIGLINKIIRELVVKGKTNIGDFIKNKRERGYHLNHKILV